MSRPPADPERTGAAADLVSVVVPAGAADEQLRVQLEALARQQTDFPFEVVVALNAVDPLEERSLTTLVSRLEDARFRFVVANAKRSAAHARNRGAAAARGSRLAFCDSDDIVRDGWLQALVDGLADADAVGGHLSEFVEGGSVPKWRPPATPGALPEFLGHAYLVSASMAITADAFWETGGFDETLTRGEDIAFSWRLTKLGRRLGYVPTAVVDYRVRPSIRLMVRQHYLYGIGMSEVLLREGTPGGEGRGTLLRPNNQAGGLRSPVGLLRKAAIGTGRVVGMVQHRRAGRHGGDAPNR